MTTEKKKPDQLTPEELKKAAEILAKIDSDSARSFSSILMQIDEVQP